MEAATVGPYAAASAPELNCLARYDSYELSIFSSPSLLATEAYAEAVVELLAWLVIWGGKTASSSETSKFSEAVRAADRLLERSAASCC